MGRLAQTPVLWGLRFPERVTVSALVTVAFSFDDEPTGNCKNELTVAASMNETLCLRRFAAGDIRIPLGPP
jgi:hypothetical protein